MMETGDGGESSSKNDSSSSKNKSSEPVQMSCKFFLQKSESAAGWIEAEVHFIDGEVGRDGVQQIIQYITNKSKGL